MAQTVSTGTPINLTASGVVSPNGCSLIGFYVASTSGGTIVLRDGGSAGGAVTGTITPSVGWNPCPFSFSNGCYATIGGTINVTFSFQP